MKRYLKIGGIGLIILWIGLIQLSLDVSNGKKLIRREPIKLSSTLQVVPNFQPGVPPEKDYMVALLTHVSFDKLYRVRDLVLRWPGPISCAVYTTTDDMINLPTELTGTTVSIHLVTGFNTSAPYPINMMRQVALDYSDSEYIFAIDVDFIPTMTTLDTIQGILQTMRPASNQVWVVPAFERHMVNDRVVTAQDLPQTKNDLMAEIATKRIEPFHVAYFAPGHGPTNFKKWYTAETPYKIQWEPRFEPYIVAYREGLPSYWTGFTGYGYNKLSWIMELNLAGYSFQVLPNVFLVHMNHPGRQERWPKSAMQSEYFNKFIPYLKRVYGKDAVVDVDWT